MVPQERTKRIVNLEAYPILVLVCTSSSSLSFASFPFSSLLDDHLGGGNTLGRHSGNLTCQCSIEFRSG